MPPKPGSAIKRYKRKAIGERRVGIDAKCATCPEDRPEALIAGSRPKICAECDRKRRGQATTDKHHLRGQANGPEILSVPVNDHRALSVAQYDWPKETRENPTGDPYVKMAASIRGYIHTQRYLMEEQRSLIEKQHYILDQLLQPLPEMLEARAKSKRKKGKN